MGEKRENFKKVKISDRNFIIRKFDALTGSYTVLKVGALFAPLFKGIDFSKIDIKSKDVMKNMSAIDLAGIGASLSSLKEEDYSYVQRKCLQVCYEDLPAGSAQVLKENLSFGVVDIDSKIVLALMIQTIVFNVTDFFPEDLLGLITGGLNTLPQD